MIKIEIKQTGTSYFKKENERIFDLTRNNVKRIKIFGFTIWEKSDIICDSDIIELNGNKIGFDKEKK